MSVAGEPYTDQLTILPTEILIDIISLVPWSRKGLTDIKLVCQRFNSILDKYEHSIACTTVRTQFPVNSRLRFPSLLQSHPVTFGTVAEVHSRWKALNRIGDNCRTIKERNGKSAGWMTVPWVRLQEVGLCLLYRLQDCSSYNEQTTLIKNLPATSLVVLLFTLTMSIHQLRADGPDIIHEHSPIQVAAFRAEMELACEELILQHGPSYLMSLLDQESKAIKTLDDEYGSMETRQFPYANGQPRSPTLISVLRRAFSARLGCHLKDNDKHMWSLLHQDRLRNIDEKDAAKIVHGVCVKGLRDVAYRVNGTSEPRGEASHGQVS